MFFNKLLFFFKSNIKLYKDEKQLEEKKRKEILLEYNKKNDLKKIYELDKKLAENEYSAESKLIGRLKDFLISIKNKLLERLQKIYDK